ncbi:MAG: hypothetical protein K2F92_04450, partial [Alistipes sp.]|nr:hypothetical protein [Alistipes sp.]
AKATYSNRSDFTKEHPVLSFFDKFYLFFVKYRYLCRADGHSAGGRKGIAGTPPQIAAPQKAPRTARRNSPELSTAAAPSRRYR